MSWRPNPDYDRCAGVLLGLAAGDALGAGYEFAHVPTGPVAMIGGGLGGWEPGEWTDDTQMALCIAEEAATGNLDPTAVASRFLDWYRSGPADVGIQTRSVLGRAKTPADVATVAKAYFADHPNGAAGNGSLMRTAPVALCALGDDALLAELAVAVSSLTHADPLAGEACILIGIGIDRAIREGRLDGVYDDIGLLPADRQPYWQQRLAEVEAGPPGRFNPNGFVVHAFQAALAAIWHTPIPEDQPCRHLQDALQAAVHIGNDTDTVAAIAGGLLGARWGASAIPVDWQLLLHGWPGHRAKDLVRLAMLTVRGGKPDSSGWPTVEDMSDHYQRNWPAEPLVQPLAEDPGVLMANYPGALEAKADIVVSLCRMGRKPLGDQHAEIWLVDGDAPAANPNLDFVLGDLAKAIVR
jgi:ADP-ribosyl-[dinitrogen reductase] hydrolase